MVSVRLLYELKRLNGQKVVVVYKPEGVAHAKKEYPNTPIYSIREIEALEGLETRSNGCCKKQNKSSGERFSRKKLLNNTTQKGR